MDETKRKRATVLLAILTLCNFALIFGNSLLSFEDSSEKSSFITSILAHIFRDVEFETLEHIVRKCAHFFEFFCLGAFFTCLIFVVLRLDIRKTKSFIIVPFFGCLLAASTDEMIQVFTDRGNSVYDVLLDFSGSLTAMGIFFAVIFICKRVRKHRDPAAEGPPTEQAEQTEQTEQAKQAEQSEKAEQPDKTE